MLSATYPFAGYLKLLVWKNIAQDSKLLLCLLIWGSCFQPLFVFLYLQWLKKHVYACGIPLLISIHLLLSLSCSWFAGWLSLRGSPRSPHSNICILVVRNAPRHFLYEQIEDRNWWRSFVFSPRDMYSWFSLFVVVVFYKVAANTELVNTS